MSRRAGLIVLLSCILTSATFAQVQWTEVITDNQPLPDISGNYNLYSADLASNGDILFVTGIASGTGAVGTNPMFHTDDYWLLDKGSIQSVARFDGDNTDPPVLGVALNNNSQVLFSTPGLRLVSLGGPTPVTNTFVDGQGDGIGVNYNLNGFVADEFSLNDNGDIAVNTSEGILSGNATQPLYTLASNGPAPGTPYNFSGSADDWDFGAPLVNSSGLVAFIWGLSDVPQDYLGSGLWIGHNSSDLQLVAVGDLANINDPVRIAPRAAQSLSDNGKLLFSAVIQTGSPKSRQEQNAEFIYQNGSATQIDPTGQSVPGLAGAAFSQVAWSIMSKPGTIATRAMITGPGIDSTNDIGIWTGDPGSQTLALQTGSMAPGTPDVFSDLLPYRINTQGQILFVGVLSGTDVTSSNDFGYWLWSPDGADQLLVRAGEPIDLGNGLTAPAIPAAGQYLTESESWTNFDDPEIFVPKLDDTGQTLWTFDANNTVGFFETQSVPEPDVILMPVILFAAASRRKRY